MRRPVVALSISFAGGISAARFCDHLIVTAVFASLMLMLLLTRCRHRMIYALLLLFFLGAFDFMLIENRDSPLADIAGELAVIEGRVQSLEERPYGYQMVIAGRWWEFDGKAGALKEKLLLNASGNAGMIEGFASGNPQSLVGRDISFLGRLESPSGQRNPGLFDYRFYLRTRGIEYILSGSLHHMIVKGAPNPFQGSLARVKYRFSEALDDNDMDAEAKSLLLGMLFGDKTLLSEDVYDVFQRNGTAHILAVSGIHVGVVYALVNKIFLRRKKTAFSRAVTIAFLLLYAALASFSPSVMRAVTMIIVHIFSEHLHKRYDLLCCTSFSAFLLLLIHPYALFQLGFQLSFLAVFTLAFVLPFVNSRLGMLSANQNAIRNAVLTVFAPTASLQLMLIPVIAFNFQYISLSAFLINIPVIVLAGLIIPAGILLLFFSFIGGGCFCFFSSVLEILLDAMAALNCMAGGWSFSSFNVVSPNKVAVILFYLLIFFISSECFWDFYRRRKSKHIFVVLVSLALLSVLISASSGGNGLRADIVFVDVGQGDCVHIRTPSGQNILIDGGGKADYDMGKKVLLPYFLKNRVSCIDLALVTHLHTDHYGGVASLCRLMRVKRLGLYSLNRCREDKILSDTGLASRALVYLSKGDKIKIDEVVLEILYPPYPDENPLDEVPSGEDDENARSLLIKVYISGLSVLVTGDMGSFEEKAVMESYGADLLSSDILKVAHHGSATSTSDGFVRAVNPRVAVIQSGKNNFGHPHPDVVEKLNKAGIMLYRTDKDGAVLLRIKQGKILAHTMLR